MDITHAVKLPQTITQELICQICLKMYRRPKQLSYCGHVFCTECLQKIQKPGHKPGHTAIECPCCQMVSHLNHGPEKSLRTNLPLYKITEIIKGMKKEGSRPSSSESKHSDECKDPSLSKEAPVQAAAQPCCPDFALYLPTLLCAHCNSEFCMKCEQNHWTTVKSEAVSLAGEVIQNLDLIYNQPSGIEGRLDYLRNEFNSITAGLSDKLSSSISESVKGLCDINKEYMIKLMEKAKSLSDEEIRHLEELAEKWKNPEIHKIKIEQTAQIAAGEFDGDFAKMHQEIKTLNEEVAYLGRYCSQKLPDFSFQMSIELEKELSEFLNTRDLGSISITMSEPSADRIKESLKTESNLETKIEMKAEIEKLEPCFKHLEPFGRSFYENLKLFKSLKGNDALGFEVSRPTGCCWIQNPKFGNPVLLAIHNGRRISLITANFGFEATFEIDQSKVEGDEVLYLGWDIACDFQGSIFTTCHRRATIFKFRISHEYKVRPTPFAQIRNDRFCGLEVSNDLCQLFSATTAGIHCYSCADGQFLSVIPYPRTFDGCLCYLRSIFQDKLIVSIGHKFFSFPMKLSDEHPSVHADLFIDLEQDDLETIGTVRVVALDSVGSVANYDCSRSKLDVFSFTNLKSPLVCSTTFEETVSPFALCVLPPHGDYSSPVLAMTDWSTNSIRFYTSLSE